MKSRILALTLLPALLWLTSPSARGQERTIPNDTEVLARGPVHEGFAEPVDFRPQPGPIIAKKVPDPVEEAPPDQKPDGHDVRWIPGYWAWDAESNDYLWISGFWRDVPPGHRWVAGTWQQVAGGWQWSPGFWAADEVTSVNYVAPPPAPIDAGPSVPASQPTDIYVPGCWVWRQPRFLWRPGYWVGYRPGWVWVPAHYVCTPGGCVFIEGYWDRPLEGRGLLFAPVRIRRRVLAGWVYTPRFVIRSDFLMGALFIGPARHQYYFGDYFADSYVKRGFVAWMDYRPTKQSYDPCYSYYRMVYRSDPAWDRNLHTFYQARFSGAVPRPPHTFVQQEQTIRTLSVNRTANTNILRNTNITNVQNVTVLTPLAQVHNMSVTRLSGLAPTPRLEPAHVVKLQTVTREQVTRERRDVEHVHQVAQTRREVERKLVTAGPSSVKPAETRLELPRSPVARPRPAARPPSPVLPKHEERTEPGRSSR
jgi:hypothetical protein